MNVVPSQLPSSLPPLGLQAFKPLPGLAKAPTAPATPPASEDSSFISSDTADMVDNIRAANARYGIATPAVKQAPPEVITPHTPEMTEMMENINQAKARDARDEMWVGGRKIEAGPSTVTQSTNNPTTLVSLDTKPEEEDDHKIRDHALLGAHLGLDTIEMAAQQSAEGAAEQAAEGLNPNAIWDITKDAAGENVRAIAHAGIHSGVGAALMGGVAASGALGVAMLAIGGSQIKSGLKKKDGEEVLEGVNSTLVGARSALSATVMSGLAVNNDVLATVAHGAEAVLTPLGVIHGAIDVGLGVKDVVVGIKHHDGLQQMKGAMGIGLGGCLAAAALGGGIPFLVAAAVLVGGRIVEHVAETRRDKREEAEKAASAPPAPEAKPAQ